MFHTMQTLIFKAVVLMKIIKELKLIILHYFTKSLREFHYAIAEIFQRI